MPDQTDHDAHLPRTDLTARRLANMAAAETDGARDIEFLESVLGPFRAVGRPHSRPDAYRRS